MTYRQDREEFTRIIEREGIAADVATKLLRYSTTLTRLAVAQCNGDWPCDNGERKTKPCIKCESGYAPSALNRAGVCPDCRTVELATALCQAHGLIPDFAGDPRGCVVKVKVPSGYNNSWGGDGFVCVPAPHM